MHPAPPVIVKSAFRNIIRSIPKNPLPDKDPFNIGLVVILLMVAVFPRFFFIGHDISPNGVDEGIQIMAGRMMDNGYELYDQINSVQPPFMIMVYSLVDLPPTFFRVLSALSSILIIGLVIFAAGRAGGWKVMVASGSFLILDVMFLLESRLASLDMFSLFWSVLGVTYLIVFRETGRRGYLIFSGILVGISAMTKLFGVITFGSIGIILLLDIFKVKYPLKTMMRKVRLPKRKGYQPSVLDPTVFSLGFLLIVFGTLLWFGPYDIINGTILNQMHRPVASPSIKLEQFLEYLLPVTATVIFFFLGLKDLYKMSEGVVVIIGSIFLVYFLLQAMTFDHHLIFLSPMFALGAGFGIKRFLSIMERMHIRPLKELSRVGPVILILAASSVGSGLILHVHYRGEPAPERVAGIVEDITDSNDFIISGDPLIPVIADRPVPPSLVNVAKIQYPEIDSDLLNRSLIDYGVEVVILTYHLSEIEGFSKLVHDNFHLRHRISDRQNPISDDEVVYCVFVIRSDSILMDNPRWCSSKLLSD